VAKLQHVPVACWFSTGVFFISFTYLNLYPASSYAARLKLPDDRNNIIAIKKLINVFIWLKIICSFKGLIFYETKILYKTENREPLSLYTHSHT
jgi:hypothetical protein